MIKWLKSFFKDNQKSRLETPKEPPPKSDYKPMVMVKEPTKNKAKKKRKRQLARKSRQINRRLGV